MDSSQITPKPIPPLSLVKRLLRKLPWFCSYCGRLYVKCHSRTPDGVSPSYAPGRCCPNGHEGYVDEFLGHSTVRRKFDLVKDDSK
ncbi:hypothetical protein [Owenweeksia hongkongensis]|uniref:hypothetical protein n=1 Tax=Owenweeksia hongkongensis TaxID=253245 RepID=UPI003A91C536